MRKRLAAAVAAVPLLAAAPALAAEDRECRNGVFPEEQNTFGLARVAGPGRLVFLGDADGCPSAAPTCAGRAYVTPGDVLVTGRTLGAYVCAYFVSKAGGTAGWVPRGRLSPVAVAANPAPPAWAGRWREYDDELRLSARGGRVSAAGEAFWPSANPSLKDRPGGPNIGQIEGDGRPSGTRLYIGGQDPDECAADLWLVGPFLVVRDNMRCGGMNVTFTGVYRRR